MADKTVDGYIAGLSGWQAQAVLQVREIINQVASDSDEAIKWAQPVWSFMGPFAYVKAYKSHVNFGFWRGVDLDDPKNLLAGTGDMMRHVKLSSLEDINTDAFTAFVENAVNLNRVKGDPTKAETK